MNGWNLENTYAELPAPLFVLQAPVPVTAPALAYLNEPLAHDLGLEPEALRTPEGVALLSGNAVPPGSRPLAQAYAGHQFGHFTMLGDGRAILLGEQIDPSGRRRDLQLKGSGRTPFSRNGDGRAALGPMLREVLIGEALHALGIPCSRGLSVVTTGEPVFRQEGALPGAVLLRVAASHIRVGTFEYAAARADSELVRTLAAYTLKRHAPDAADRTDHGAALLEFAVASQARLVAAWMLVGFIHGVMNTDNMFLSGETADFGPCAFMDAYNPATVFSSIDSHGRYSYGNQPGIALWNLNRLAEALLPILDTTQEAAVERAGSILKAFEPAFRSAFLDGMRAKLGLTCPMDEDEELIEDWLHLLYESQTDFTNSFLELERLLGTGETAAESMVKWSERWLARLDRQPGNRIEAIGLMRRTNPRVIPRNHLVEAALAGACDGDWSLWNDLLDSLRRPWEDHPLHSRFQTPGDQAFTRNYRTFCGT